MMSCSEEAHTSPITFDRGKPTRLNSLIASDGERPNRWAIMKSGLVALRDVEHLRAHFDPRRRHREGAQFELLDLLQVLDDRDRLAPGRVVVKDVGDLLPLSLPPSFSLTNCTAAAPATSRWRRSGRDTGSACRRPRRRCRSRRSPGILSSVVVWFSA